MASKVNILIDQGTTFNTTFTFVDVSNNTIDFSTYTGASQMRKSYSSSVAYSFDVTLGNNGIITISMSANSTTTIPAGRYLYDLEVQDLNGVKSRLAEGIVTVTPEITR